MWIPPTNQEIREITAYCNGCDKRFGELRAEKRGRGAVIAPDNSGKCKGQEFRWAMRNWRIPNPKRDYTPGCSVKTAHWTRSTNLRDIVLFPLITSGAGKYRARGKYVNISIKASKRQVYGDLYPAQWDSKLVPLFKKSGFKVLSENGRDYVEIPGGRKWIMYRSADDGFQDKMRRISWDKPAPTIVAHLAKDGYMFIHPWLHRTITVREAARFQSFPDHFEFQGSMANQFRQVGNAVPPLLAEALGKVIIEALE